MISTSRIWLYAEAQNLRCYMSEASSAKGIKLTIEDVSIGFNLVQTHVEELMDFILTKKCSMFC